MSWNFESATRANDKPNVLLLRLVGSAGSAQQKLQIQFREHYRTWASTDPAHKTYAAETANVGRTRDALHEAKVLVDSGELLLETAMKEGRDTAELEQRIGSAIVRAPVLARLLNGMERQLALAKQAAEESWQRHASALVGELIQQNKRQLEAVTSQMTALLARHAHDLIDQLAAAVDLTFWLEADRSQYVPLVRPPTASPASTPAAQPVSSPT